MSVHSTPTLKVPLQNGEKDTTDKKEKKKRSSKEPPLQPSTSSEKPNRPKKKPTGELPPTIKKVKLKAGSRALIEGHQIQEEALPEDSFPISHVQLVNKTTWADIYFITPSGARIAAHACIVVVRCPSLVNPDLVYQSRLATLRKAPPKSADGAPAKGAEFKVNPIITNPDIFVELLKFVYAGRIEFDKLSLPHTVELLAAAMCYEGLERLVWLCERRIKQLISINHVHQIIFLANKWNLKYIKEFGMHYAVAYWNKFIRDTAFVRSLGIDLFQECVITHQTFLSGELSPLPVHPPPMNTFLIDLKTLYNQMKGNDIAFKLIERNYLGVSGSLFRAHRCMVAGRCPELATLCATVVHNPNRTEAEVNLNPVQVKGITTEGFTALLKWLYYGEQSIPPRAAVELVSFSKEYNLPELLKLATFSLKYGVNDHEMVLQMLDLERLKDMPDYFKKEFEIVKPKCVNYIVNNLVKVNVGLIRENHMSITIAPAVILAMQEQFIKKNGTRKVLPPPVAPPSLEELSLPPPPPPVEQ